MVQLSNFVGKGLVLDGGVFFGACVIGHRLAACPNSSSKTGRAHHAMSENKYLWPAAYADVIILAVLTRDCVLKATYASSCLQRTEDGVFFW